MTKSTPFESPFKTELIELLKLIFGQIGPIWCIREEKYHWSAQVRCQIFKNDFCLKLWLTLIPCCFIFTVSSFSSVRCIKMQKIPQKNFWWFLTVLGTPFGLIKIEVRKFCSKRCQMSFGRWKMMKQWNETTLMQDFDKKSFLKNWQRTLADQWYFSSRMHQIGPIWPKYEVSIAQSIPFWMGFRMVCLSSCHGLHRLLWPRGQRLWTTLFHSTKFSSVPNLVPAWVLP